MEKITIKDFDEVYALFEKAFPLAELRPYESMKELFENNEFVIYSYQRENQIN